jgi:hypothetical protein
MSCSRTVLSVWPRVGLYMYSDERNAEEEPVVVGFADFVAINDGRK